MVLRGIDEEHKGQRCDLALYMAAFLSHAHLCRSIHGSISIVWVQTLMRQLSFKPTCHLQWGNRSTACSSAWSARGPTLCCYLPAVKFVQVLYGIAARHLRFQSFWPINPPATPKQRQLIPKTAVIAVDAFTAATWGLCSWHAVRLGISKCKYPMWSSTLTKGWSKWFWKFGLNCHALVCCKVVCQKGHDHGDRNATGKGL